MSRQFSVYILANARRTVLYIGVTGDLTRRIGQHRAGTGSRFTRRYHAERLVYVETYDRPMDAIRREKQLKAGPRWRKELLIEQANPGWIDLMPGD